MGIFGRRWLVWTLLAVVLAGLLAVALWPRPTPVTVAEVTRGPMRVTVQDEGRTRVQELYSVSATITGEMERIALEAGDSVTAGETVVARIRPSDAPFLDPRSEAEARARVKAAEAAVTLAEAELRRARAERDYARQELDRTAYLAKRGDVSQSRLDQARTRFRSDEAAVAAAEAALRLRREELAEARARLTEPRPRDDMRVGSCCVAVTAPVSGQVLRVHRESAGPVEAGTTLLSIGDPSQIEIVVDLLSTDAVKVKPGAEVAVVGWGGEQPLPGRVRRVEPYGFTEVSALGIEEQRVNVIVDIPAERAAEAGLAHGFRVIPEITVWQSDEVLRLPLGALFRDSRGNWSTFRVVDGQARLTTLKIGRTNDAHAQVLEGLSPGDRVVLYPDDQLRDGGRVAQRLEAG